MLTSEKVTEMFLSSLFTEEEINGATKPPENAKKVEGITTHIAFHPGRLESYREDVKKCLEDLPDEFLPGTGGGSTFLNLCFTKDGKQWTSYHKVMEQLCILAIGLDLGSFLLPRKMWSILPGGMPYFGVK